MSAAAFLPSCSPTSVSSILQFFLLVEHIELTMRTAKKSLFRLPRNSIFRVDRKVSISKHLECEFSGFSSLRPTLMRSIQCSEMRNRKLTNSHFKESFKIFHLTGDMILPDGNYHHRDRSIMCWQKKDKKLCWIDQRKSQNKPARRIVGLMNR